MDFDFIADTCDGVDFFIGPEGDVVVHAQPLTELGFEMVAIHLHVNTRLIELHVNF